MPNDVRENADGNRKNVVWRAKLFLSMNEKVSVNAVIFTRWCSVHAAYNSDDGKVVFLHFQ